MFADAAQTFYRELARLTRSARIAGQGAALVLPAESRRWPGFLPRLLELEQDGLVIAPAGIAAVAASLQTTDLPESPRLRRHIARVADHSLAADIEYVASVSTSPARALPVTHILFGGDSIRFPEVGLLIGTEEVSNAPHIALPRAAAGVSRRHCSLRREGERTVLVDHSRFGTWVNGARVRERADGASRRSRARRHARRRVHADLHGGGRSRRCAMKKRRAFEVFTLSFLDCICCGFGAVVLFYTIVQAQVGAQEITRLKELTGEVSKLEEEVKEGTKNLVMLRNTLEKTDEDAAAAQARAIRVAAELKARSEQSSHVRPGIASRAARTSTSSWPTSSRSKKASSACRAARSTRRRRAIASSRSAAAARASTSARCR